MRNFAIVAIVALSTVEATPWKQFRANLEKNEVDFSEFDDRQTFNRGWMSMHQDDADEEDFDKE